MFDVEGKGRRTKKGKTKEKFNGCHFAPRWARTDNCNVQPNLFGIFVPFQLTTRVNIRNLHTKISAPILIEGQRTIHKQPKVFHSQMFQENTRELIFLPTIEFYPPTNEIHTAMPATLFLKRRIITKMAARGIRPEGIRWRIFVYWGLSPSPVQQLNESGAPQCRVAVR